MTLQLGQVAPDFEADTTQGRIRFHEWLGNSWGVLFSHPKDYTPVCTTELGMTARLKPEFDRRNVKAIGLSVDTLDRHAGWEADIAETQGTAVNFPMISDPDKQVATLYGMIHPEADPSVTVRTVYVIDPNKKIRLMLIYPPSAGRNFDEVIRVIDSLQTTDRHKVATPVNWRPGDRAIVLASLSDEQAKAQFPQGFTTEKPYLRWVDLPKENA
ncbi:peroxiredoxin [Roseomonas sp. BN140053]|uniref:peroxiredoxin n=1 Tax=Roseomonas sp. BN140053 TaxID=3391898 RepID=UPI0039E9D37C